MKFQYSPEAESAIAENRPLVALESTVIAHGLPYPQNLETAHRMESVIRENGAVPATIAVIDGVPTIGLSDSQIEFLSTSKDISKLSVRDLPGAVARRYTGATTVATTMFFAHQAGIKVFATGGIGGVHRDGASDISADLPTIASTPMVTVCAGAKIVLDLESTREWLETHGVCVVGWKSDDFPAFYSRKSGLLVDSRVESAKEALLYVKARDELNLSSAILITVPVPKEESIQITELEEYLSKALDQSRELGITGKEVTPFLLSKLSELSGGKTIDSNVSLLANNANVAALIAVEIGNS